jgi:hypothetical protein
LLNRSYYLEPHPLLRVFFLQREASAGIPVAFEPADAYREMRAYQPPDLVHRFLQVPNGRTNPTTTTQLGREGGLGSIVSRIYYAAFGSSSRYAETYLGFEPRCTADDHGRLVAHLKRSRRHFVGMKLGTLRESRNICDYQHKEIAGIDAMSTDAFEMLEYILKALPPPDAQGS